MVRRTFGHLSVFPESPAVESDEPSTLVLGYPVAIRTGGEPNVTVHLTIEQARTIWTELGAALQSLEQLPAARHAREEVVNLTGVWS
jgi:hypothetical protein